MANDVLAAYNVSVPVTMCNGDTASSAINTCNGSDEKLNFFTRSSASSTSISKILCLGGGGGNIGHIIPNLLTVGRKNALFKVW